MRTRVEHLDGMRGLSILLVIGFHAYTHWSSVVPYGAAYSNIPLFTEGRLGVQLSFLLSGFLIFMTLGKCQSSGVFLFKRWSRLFPSMLLATALIYFTAPLLPERPAGPPTLISLLPGLSMIDPAWWNMALRIHTEAVEGTFWSLFVECKFYVIAALIYFRCGPRVLVPALALLFGGAMFVQALAAQTDFSPLRLLDKLCWELSLRFFGWFAAGAALCLFYQSRDWRWFGIGTGIALAASLFARNPQMAVLVSLFFAGALVAPGLQRALNNRVLNFFGFISYPLYLIHENAMIALIVKLHALLPGLPGFLYPLPPVALLASIAYLIATRYDIKIRHWLESRRAAATAEAANTSS